jgi:hypothetical protein
MLLKLLLGLALVCMLLGCGPKTQIVLCNCPPQGELAIDSRCPSCLSSIDNKNRALFISTEARFYDDIMNLREEVLDGQLTETRMLWAGSTDSERRPTRNNIIRQLKWLACGGMDNPAEEGLSILYISSHGKRISISGQPHSYLIPQETIPTESENSDISKLLGFQEIFDSPLMYMDKSCPKRKYLVIIDSCYSGGLLADLPPSGSICESAANNRYSRLRVLTSSRADQLSLGGNVSSTSLFTNSLRSALQVTSKERNISDLWLAARALIHKNPEWEQFRQEPAMFYCAGANWERTPLFHAASPLSSSESFLPIVVALRGLTSNGTAELETDHCAKLAFGTILKPTHSRDSNINQEYTIFESPRSALSTACLVRIGVRTADLRSGIRYITTSEFNQLKSRPGTLLLANGLESLPERLPVRVENGSNRERVIKGIEQVRELMKVTKFERPNDTPPMYYDLQATNTIGNDTSARKTVQWWQKVANLDLPTDGAECSSILPVTTPAIQDGAESEIELLRDLVKLYQISFWEKLKVSAENPAFPVQLGLFAQGEDKLVGDALGGTRCLTTVAGKHSVRLLRSVGRPTADVQRRYVYLCLLSGTNPHHPSQIFPGALMLYPKNQREEQEGQPSSGGHIVLDELNLVSGDSKLLVLVTSRSPRSPDFCRQGPILFNDSTKGQEYDLSLNHEREAARVFMETRPGPMALFGPQPRVTKPSTATLTSTATPQPEEETLQRLWIKVR